MGRAFGSRDLRGLRTFCSPFESPATELSRGLTAAPGLRPGFFRGTPAAVSCTQVPSSRRPYFLGREPAGPGDSRVSTIVGASFAPSWGQTTISSELDILGVTRGRRGGVVGADRGPEGGEERSSVEE